MGKMYFPDDFSSDNSSASYTARSSDSNNSRNSNSSNSKGCAIFIGWIIFVTVCGIIGWLIGNYISSSDNNTVKKSLDSNIITEEEVVQEEEVMEVSSPATPTTNEEDTSPSASINRVWTDHNVYHNGNKGMKIHINLEVDNMKEENIYVYTYYYYGDNTIPLKDKNGNNLYYSSSHHATYKKTNFDDIWHFIPYSFLNMQRGYGYVDLSFDVVIKDGYGNLLARNSDNQFNLTEN